jgi:hypothetical protein
MNSKKETSSYVIVEKDILVVRIFAAGMGWKTTGTNPCWISFDNQHELASMRSILTAHGFDVEVHGDILRVAD